jgi:hypothetical protein
MNRRQTLLKSASLNICGAPALGQMSFDLMTIGQNVEAYGRIRQIAIQADTAALSITTLSMILSVLGLVLRCSA